jgi:sugar lactone lactonase YvrE
MFGASSLFAALIVTTLATGLDLPNSIAVHPNGDVYVGERRRISIVTPAGTVRTLATDVPSTAFIAVAEDGTVYSSDLFERKVYKISPAGVVTTFLSGLLSPRGLAVGPDGNLYVGDGWIRRVTPAGQMTTLTGLIGSPLNIVVTSDGTLYFATEGAVRTLRKMTPDGVVTDLAPISGYFDVHEPRIARAADATFYLVDVNIHSIRRLRSDGSTELAAGDDSQSGIIDGAGALARFSNPRMMAFGPDGRLYVADTFNNAIRVIRFANAKGCTKWRNVSCP